MLNEEHLIENALVTLERNGDFEDFDIPLNQEMAESVGITLDQVWGMAVHVFTAFILPLMYEKDDDSARIEGKEKTDEA